ncbi:polysaccharide deacetylase family protein [Polymorphobacter sp.]|uniref:polysaccharide deacetylase family protein n=1 Tax=Polymorphobacter sp. TaxID=1909290 RepID=UPI003F71F189
MASNPRVPFRLASDRRPLAPPPGGRLIVHLVVNIENWRFDHPMPRKLLPAPHGAEAVPDVPNFSWAEYGMRCGMPRLLETLGRRGLQVTCAFNAGVIESYPDLALAVREAGWEFMGHGLHQRALTAEASEADAIAEALSRIADFTGRPVQGWLGPGLRQTVDTLDLLAGHGLRYCCDWVLDDLPVWMKTRHGPMIGLPYSLEINDSVIYAVEKHRSAEMHDRLVSTLETFASELAQGPRIVTLGLHPHLIAVPHRFIWFERMLDLLCARPDTLFMTGSQIADWFEAASDPAERAAAS